MALAATADPVATFDGVAVSFGDVRALDGVDVAVGPGMTALLGQNGAGKTTFLRLLLGEQEADAGRVVLRDDVAGGIGAVPQDSALPGLMRVREIVEYAAWLQGARASAGRARTEVVLEQVGLSDRAGSRLRALSGGMQRRVALATALVHEPRMLVLDEPTAGLDPSERDRFNGVLETVVAAGTAVVLSTHILEDIEGRAGHVIALDRGRVAFDAPYASFAGEGSLRDAYARTIAGSL